MKKLLFIVGVCVFCLAPIEAKEEVKTPEIKVETVKVYPQRNPDVVSELERKINCTKNWNEGCTDSTLQISQEDAIRLMKIAVAEGGTEGVEGQYLIMRVVINRVNSEFYPDTIEEVIKQPFQFDTYTNGSYEAAEPTTESHLALAMLEANQNPNEEIEAFETKSNGSTLLKYYDLSFVKGNHAFYIKKD